MTSNSTKPTHSSTHTVELNLLDMLLPELTARMLILLQVEATLNELTMGNEDIEKAVKSYLDINDVEDSATSAIYNTHNIGSESGEMVAKHPDGSSGKPRIKLPAGGTLPTTIDLPTPLQAAQHIRKHCRSPGRIDVTYINPMGREQWNDFIFKIKGTLGEIKVPCYETFKKTQLTFKLAKLLEACTIMIDYPTGDAEVYPGPPYQVKIDISKVDDYLTGELMFSLAAKLRSKPTITVRAYFVSRSKDDMTELLGKNSELLRGPGDMLGKFVIDVNCSWKAFCSDPRTILVTTIVLGVSGLYWFPKFLTWIKTLLQYIWG